MTTAIRTIGVVGTGVIGASWTALFLARGFKVLVSDPAPGASEKLKSYIDQVWPSLEKLGLSSGASRSNYNFVGPDLRGHYQELDFVQENAPEKVDLKRKVIGEIDEATRRDVVIASSSSGLPSSQFIQECKVNPSRVLIGHPFNPPHLMPLVEVVPNDKTSPNSVSATIEFYTSLGKRPVLIKQELPGFAANRLQVALLQEAFSLVQRGVLSAEDVDACVTTSLGPRWALAGPFMSKVLGGGGGSEGFKHGMQHLGPAEQTWIKDMREHEFELNDANLEVLCASVEKQLQDHDPDTVEKQRDELLLGLLNNKKAASALV